MLTRCSGTTARIAILQLRCSQHVRSQGSDEEKKKKENDQKNNKEDQRKKNFFYNNKNHVTKKKFLEIKVCGLFKRANPLKQPLHTDVDLFSHFLSCYSHM
jgi:hypothetical protein